MIQPVRTLGTRLFRPFYHPDRFYPVFFGPLHGRRLRFGPQLTLAQLLGFWERNNFAAISRLRDAGFFSCPRPVVYDIGANFGLYTVFFSLLLRDRGRVFAFEPGDVPRAGLIDNLEHNKIGNVLVENLACSNTSGTAEFYTAKHHYDTASLRVERAKRPNAELQTVRVRTTTLDDHWEKAALPSERVVFVKIDIEGAADSVLPHSECVIRSQQPFFLVESHSLIEDRAISAMIQNFDYRGYRTTNNRWVTRLDRVHPDPDGVWGTVLLIPNEHERAARTALGH
jgi:FkbM family methyltransferase